MSELSEKLLNLEISEGIFKDIKYFITGEVHEKVSWAPIQLLRKTTVKYHYSSP